ncbi:hypothetical protein B2A_04678, partial [mine drainage metagenome]
PSIESIRLYRISKDDLIAAEAETRSLLSEAMSVLDHGLSKRFKSIRRDMNDSSFGIVKAVNSQSRQLAMLSYTLGMPEAIEFQGQEDIYFTCNRVSDYVYRFTRTSRDYPWLVESYRIIYERGSPFVEDRSGSISLSITDTNGNMADELGMVCVFDSRGISDHDGIIGV